MMTRTDPAREAVLARPAVALALPAGRGADDLAAELELNGVRVKRTAGDCGRLARVAGGVTAVVLSAGGAEQSGWLTCAKLLAARPNLRVILIDERFNAKRERLALFAGATAVLDATQPAEELAGAILVALEQN